MFLGKFALKIIYWEANSWKLVPKDTILIRKGSEDVCSMNISFLFHSMFLLSYSNLADNFRLLAKTEYKIVALSFIAGTSSHNFSQL